MQVREVLEQISGEMDQMELSLRRDLESAVRGDKVRIKVELEALSRQRNWLRRLTAAVSPLVGSSDAEEEPVPKEEVQTLMD